MNNLKKLFSIVIVIILFAVCRYIWHLLGGWIFGSSVGHAEIHSYIEKFYLFFISIIAIKLAVQIAKKEYKNIWPSIFLIEFIIIAFTFEK